MTEQTETERNEVKIDRENGLKILDMVNAINKGTHVKTETEMAIHYLKEMAKKQSCIEYYEALQIAIAALKQQSESERRIERVRDLHELFTRDLKLFPNNMPVIYETFFVEIGKILEGKAE